MNDLKCDIFDIKLLDSTWYNAITLKERIRLYKKSNKGKIINNNNNNHAAQRLEKWRKQPPFNNKKMFNTRLDSDKISQEDFLYILDDTITTLSCYIQTVPSWLDEFVMACNTYGINNSLHIPSAFKTNLMVGFLNVLDPIINKARNDLHCQIITLINSKSIIPFNRETIEDILLSYLYNNLINMISRVLILELNVARLKGELNGDTPKERFNQFLDYIHRKDFIIAIFKEYPILLRLIVECTNKWLKFYLEFLNHLCDNWLKICEIFNVNDQNDVLVELKSNVGDRHRGGKSVIIVAFKSGFKIVYKPRTLKVDEHFQNFLVWINEHSENVKYHTLKMLDESTHGWMEYVPHQGCQSLNEVQRFYERQGGYIAIMYVLQAIDFHFENIIAMGEHPMLIDLESLFHPRINEIKSIESTLIAANTMLNSILRSMLLPQRVLSNVEYSGIDVSGLSADDGQLLPGQYPYFNKTGTDEMRIERQPMKLSGGHNKPLLNKIDIDVMDFAESIMKGFTNIYRLFMKYRIELLSTDGPLRCFYGDEIRIILRPTRNYSLLLQEGFHPDLLRNALDRDLFFDKLWVGVENIAPLIKVIPSERDDLSRGDIPIFTSLTDSCDLWDSNGRKMLDFFSTSGVALSKICIQQLNERDLVKQLWFIKSSLATLALAENHVQKKLCYKPYTNKNLNSMQMHKALLSNAKSIGDQLNELAFHGEDDITWIGLSAIYDGSLTFAPLSIDLYSGLAGVSFFLGYLGFIVQDERYKCMAQKAIKTLLTLLERYKSSITSIGAFDGLGGIIYVLAHLGWLWNRDDLIMYAKSLVAVVEDLIERDPQCDIISGAAGAICGLFALYKCIQSSFIIDTVNHCVNRLIACAQKTESGIGWLKPFMGKKPLAGFAHGNAGIVLALSRAMSLTGEKSIKTIIKKAMDYEHTLFAPEEENWLDLRELPNRKKTTDVKNDLMVAWCTGAPGIGLARLGMISFFDTPKIRNDIDIALKTTITRGFGHNHSLCHGDFGNLEFLLYAYNVFKNRQIKFHISSILEKILQYKEQYGWQYGVPLNAETPGLMNGIAGIGYELLRLAEPKLVPSVLMLDPPNTNISYDCFSKSVINSCEKHRSSKIART
jgi:type 2 lantibiotic biosynthesis protein LanM